MTKILGLDVGDVRIGVALGDRNTSVSTPLCSFFRKKGQAEREILALITQHQISAIIIGLPLDSDGRETEQCEPIHNVARRLGRRTEVPIEFIDESHSTFEAKQRYLNTATGKKKNLQYAKQEGLLDALAASIILEQYFALQRDS